MRCLQNTRISLINREGSSTFTAIVDSESLTAEEILPDLALALACNCVGDSSGLFEWYEPLVDSGQITSIIVFLNDSAYVIKDKDYSDLVDMPHIAVSHRGEWIGDTSVDDSFKFVYEELGLSSSSSFVDGLKSKVF